MKPRAFFFHYNKPESKKQQKPIISIHYDNQCMFVENIVVNVPTKGRLRKRQPYFVMSGKATEIVIKDNVATVI